MPKNSPAPIGAHAFIWSPRWDRTGAHNAATRAAAAGFDLVEIPLLEPSIVDTDYTVRLLSDLDLDCTCSLGLPADCHLPAFPDQGVSFLTGAVDVAAALGSRWLTGALYGNLGTLTGSAPTGEELDTITRSLHRVASYAADRDISLGLELINRYETYILNTAEQAAALIGRIGAPNVFAHLDTFHMNIEEGSLARAVDTLGDRLGYVHLAESHRGALGAGLVPFDDLFRALSGVGYDGPLVVEAFLNADPAVTKATSSWRSHDLNPDQFAANSLRYIAGLRDSYLA